MQVKVFVKWGTYFQIKNSEAKSHSVQEDTHNEKWMRKVSLLMWARGAIKHIQLTTLAAFE